MNKKTAAGKDVLARQFNVLCEINREINYCLEVKPLLERIAESTARLLDADAVSVMMYDDRENVFKTFAGWKSWASEEPAVVFSVDEGIVGKVAATRRAMLVENPEESPDFKPGGDSRMPPIKSLMCVPLISQAGEKEKLLGVINTSRRTLKDNQEREAFSIQDIQLFEKFADQVTAAIERSRVYEEVRRRTLQLQIINDFSRILASSLQKAEGFRAALVFLADKMDLSYAQLLVMVQDDILFNFNTADDEELIPAVVRGLLAHNRIPEKAPSVLRDSRCRTALPLEDGGSQGGYLYLESRQPFYFDEEPIRKVLETIRDQIHIALENFLLFREINESKQKLEHLNKMKNELISIVSHDFRNPLTVIHAYSELLLIRPDLDHDAKKEYLHSIFAQIGHLRRLADGALKITRLESGEMAYCREKVDMQKLEEAFAMRQMPHHRIRFVYDRDLPAMYSDFDRLMEIMDNLISNAIKYSPRGGDVIVTGRKKGEFVEIQVADRGIGIAPDQLNKLFEKYYRVHDAKTKNIQGTGLGLYICRKMVEELGGQIGVRSRLGSGSTFYFTMPVFADQTA
ncbi:MAG: GAF domain-containing protein [Acidobacteria bacterium]|nr:GAF domain-containing protein [Acidobacteriota bacterium]